jgi:hypothetical protein
VSDEKAPDDLRAMIRETPAVLGNAWRTLRIVWRVDAAMVLVAVAARVLEAASTVGIAWVGRRLVDGVVDAARARQGLSAVAVWVALEFALVATRAAVKQGAELNQQTLRSRLGLEVNLQILQKASNVSYSRFEDPEFVNQMAQARREASGRPLGMVMEFLSIGQELMTLAGFAALLWGIGPWALGAVALAALPPFVAELWFGRALHQLSRRRTQRNRQLFYLESVLTSEATVKEVKLFSLGRWLTERYREIHEGSTPRRPHLSRGARGSSRSPPSRRSRSTAYYLGSSRRGPRHGRAHPRRDDALPRGVHPRAGASRSALTRRRADVRARPLHVHPLRLPRQPKSDEPDRPAPRRARHAGAPRRCASKEVSYRYPGAARDALHRRDAHAGPGRDRSRSWGATAPARPRW